MVQFNEDLTEEIRDCMLMELQIDIERNAVRGSSRLTRRGMLLWPDLLWEAIWERDEEWLALATHSHLRVSTEVTESPPPSPIAVRLAEGGIRRYYTRGLCAWIAASGDSEVEICKHGDLDLNTGANIPFSRQQVSVFTLLEALRRSTGLEAALGLPGDAKLGLTVGRV